MILGIPGPPGWWWEDRVMMAGWARTRADLCPGCGRPLWLHQHGGDGAHEETAEDYRVAVITCPAERAVESAEVEWRVAHSEDISAAAGVTSMADPRRGVHFVALSEAGEPNPDVGWPDGLRPVG